MLSWAECNVLCLVKDYHDGQRSTAAIVATTELQARQQQLQRNQQEEHEEEEDQEEGGETQATVVRITRRRLEELALEHAEAKAAKVAERSRAVAHGDGGGGGGGGSARRAGGGGGGGLRGGEIWFANVTKVYMPVGWFIIGGNVSQATADDLNNQVLVGG